MVGYMYTKPHFARILHQNTPLKKAVIFCGEAYFKKLENRFQKYFRRMVSGSRSQVFYGIAVLKKFVKFT